MADAAEYCRREQLPALVHATTIRPYSHSLSDDEKLYKTPAEREQEAARDPIVRFPEWLIAEGYLDRHTLQRIVHEVDEEVQASTDRALKAAGPPSGSAMRYLYSPDVDPTSPEFQQRSEFRGRSAHDGR